MKRILAMALSVALIAVMAIGGTVAYFTDTDEAANVFEVGSVEIIQHEKKRVNFDEDNQVEFEDDLRLMPSSYYAKTPIAGVSQISKPATDDAYWNTSADGSIDKIVTVENVGSSKAYVRTIFAFENTKATYTDKDGNVVVEDGVDSLGYIIKNYNADTDVGVWAPVEGAQNVEIENAKTGSKQNYSLYTYTYAQPVDPNTTSAPSLQQVAMASEAQSRHSEAIGGEYVILVATQAVQVENMEAFTTGYNGAEAATKALDAAFNGAVSATNHPWIAGFETEDSEQFGADLIISSKSDLLKFAKSVNEENKNYEGKTVALAADIDLSGTDWEPIGNYNAIADIPSNRFVGTFDGRGYEIKNLTVEKDVTNGNAIGLFGTLNGTVKNLTISNATINGKATGAGVVAGRIFNYGTIENVTVKNAKVTSQSYVGGIVGHSYGSVKNCTVDTAILTANVENVSNGYDNGDKVGGIVGFIPNEGSGYVIANNTAKDVKLIGYRHLGGIMGFATATATYKDQGNKPVDVQIQQLYAGTNAAENYKNLKEEELIAAVNGNTEYDTAEYQKDFTSVAVYTVSKPSELADVLKGAGAAGAGNTTIEIKNNLNMDGIEWTPIKVDGYHGADIVTVNGNGNKITNLSAPLFAGGFAGGSGIIIQNLTIEDSEIVTKNDQGAGAFIECADSMDTITLYNCHLKDSSITTDPTIDESRIGGLVGWVSGYHRKDDGPVDTFMTIENCSVINCELECFGSVGGIIGHAGANEATYQVINNCVVKECKLNSTDNGEWRVGVVVGTSNIGQLEINGITESGNILTQTGKTAPVEGNFRNLYGRLALGKTGKLTINSVTIS